MTPSQALPEPTSPAFKGLVIFLVYLMDEASAQRRAQRTGYVTRFPFRKDTEPCAQGTPESTKLPANYGTASRPPEWVWDCFGCNWMQE